MWHPPKSDESEGLRSPFYTIPGEPGIKGAARPGCRAISPIRISIARPVAIWPCANKTFFAFLLRTMSSGATPCSLIPNLQQDLFAFAKERTADVHHQLFRNAGAPAHPSAAHRQDTTDEDITYRLEAREGHAALGGQIVSVRANPDAVQTLTMWFTDYVCQQRRVE